MCEKVHALGFIILPNLGGLASGYFTRKSIKTWYDTLKKPEWRPPNWAFAPIWTTLYSGMGYASYLVYKQGGGFNGPARLPLIAYGTQLALNWAWSPIFFSCHNIKGAFFEILALDASVVVCGVMFAKINKTAALLFVPYGLWLSLATLLNYCIYINNKEAIEDKQN